jgi:hypothetical protein
MINDNGALSKWQQSQPKEDPSDQIGNKLSININESTYSPLDKIANHEYMTKMNN